MARIRTIKPEFWTDEKVMECSLNARLLFIGLWNFADDEGRMEDSPRQVKARVFPGDDFTTENVHELLTELAVNELIIRYNVDGKEYIQVKGWRHQKVNRPYRSKIPHPPNHVQCAFSESSAKGKGKGKGKEDISSVSKDTSDSSKQDFALEPESRPAEKVVVEIWNEVCGETLPKVIKLTDARKRTIRKRWAEDFNSDPDQWRAFCERIMRSMFLTGQVKAWKADFDWVLEPRNITKIIEGKFDGDDPSDDDQPLEGYAKVLFEWRQGGKKGPKPQPPGQSPPNGSTPF